MARAAKKSPKLGARRTTQRDAIARVIVKSKGPLTIDQIFQRARRSSGQLGIATVYRTVRLLLDAGDIHAVVLPDGQTRYEAADLGHHHHFRCRRCDLIFDLDVCPVSIPRGTMLPGGFHVEDHELTLYGLCPQCHGRPK